MSSPPLSYEHQFSHAAFCLQVNHMTSDQAKQIARLLHQQLLLQQETYQPMLASQWGLQVC